MTPDEMALRIVQLTNLVYFLCGLIVLICGAWIIEPWAERLMVGAWVPMKPPPPVEFCKLHSRPVSECRNQHKLDGE